MAADCVKCHGDGWYFYDEIHAKPCELCCKHDKGWWLLKEHYGDDNGKLCCLAGCGFKMLQSPPCGGSAQNEKS